MYSDHLTDKYFAMVKKNQGSVPNEPFDHFINKKYLETQDSINQLNILRELQARNNSSTQSLHKWDSNHHLRRNSSSSKRQNLIMTSQEARSSNYRSHSKKPEASAGNENHGIDM